MVCMVEGLYGDMRILLDCVDIFISTIVLRHIWNSVERTRITFVSRFSVFRETMLFKLEYFHRHLNNIGDQGR